MKTLNRPYLDMTPAPSRLALLWSINSTLTQWLSWVPICPLHVFDAPRREKAVLEKVRRLNKGPLPDRCLDAVYRELMSGSFALEKPLRIGFLGPEGTFSHMAAVRKFGSSVEYVPLSDIAAVFEEVVRGHTDYGLVPVENSIGGGG